MSQTTMLQYLKADSNSNLDAPRQKDKAKQTCSQPAAAVDLELEKLPAAAPLALADNGVVDLANVSPIERPAWPDVLITKVDSSHLSAIKRLTSTTLPMRYPDKFFSDVAQDPIIGDLARVVLLDGMPVGWIRCLMESPSPDSETSTSAKRAQIYIQALCLLAPHRQRGLATRLLAEITNATILQEQGVGSIYAHVWENNDEALEWYQKRGFKRVLLVDQYYRRLRPSGAWVVRKEVGQVSHN